MLESFVTTLLFTWAIAGLFVTFLLLRHYGNKAWDTRTQIIAAATIYLLGLGLILALVNLVGAPL